MTEQIKSAESEKTENGWVFFGQFMSGFYFILDDNWGIILDENPVNNDDRWNLEWQNKHMLTDIYGPKLEELRIELVKGFQNNRENFNGHGITNEDIDRMIYNW